ncbi:hypothetical protein U728_729 [Clostridium botulinum 202F]|nr:hypothetical protein U728_729 [Clostridium botulinum 202F]KON14742.1 hypothetical protein ACP50_00905 [Clostridium botulinum]MBY6987076.1 hypothetical protein [Clostridium botulinum]NFF21795.1 hypothetical protein [Clostridium botulinum]NFF37590.1 hypothetical protein [Clostridium botulinum]
MNVQILMKSGNTYIQEMDKAKDIQDAYVQLHLNHDDLVVLNKYTIINPLEVAEVRIINNDNYDNKLTKEQDFNITFNTNARVNKDEVAKELKEKLKSSDYERVCDPISYLMFSN